MARTIAEIYAEIVDYKDSQNVLHQLAPNSDREQILLSDLNSTSKVAIWRLWAYITAVAMYTHEVLWDIFKKEIEDKAASMQTGTARWYRDQILNWQHGDTLAYDEQTGRYVYTVVNPDNRLVSQAAVTEDVTGVVRIKVAKDDNNTLVALEATEVQSLTAYVKKIRFAGTLIAIVSGNGDILRVAGKVYFDAIRVQADVMTEVEAAINQYVGALPFNGRFSIITLIDCIQAVEGVNDVVLSSVRSKIGEAALYETIDRIHVPSFGYYRIDDSTGNTLTDTIEYIAE